MSKLCILSSVLLLAGCQGISSDSTRSSADLQEYTGNTAHFSPSKQQVPTYTSLQIHKHSSHLDKTYRLVRHSSTSRQAEQPADLWLDLASQMQLTTSIEHPRVVAQRNAYLKHPAYMRSVSERARPFLYLIKEEIEKRNLPMELVLLPVVESTFDTKAYSHASAAGLWQMLHGTGKHFGLHYDRWYDGRYDVMASTRAALDYLEYLNKFFDGDWLLSFAAYNSGEGTVQRAMRANRAKGKATDYWSLSLPAETQKYIPKILALADILKHDTHYGMDIPAMPNRPQLTVIKVDTQVDLNMAADLAGINREQLKVLNPGFKQASTSPTRPAEILVPVAHAEGFEIAMTDMPAPSTLHYVVRAGDSLGKIAKQHGTDIQALRQANNLSGNTIRIGQTLTLPGALVASTASANPTGLYKVRTGDSLSRIANRFRVSVPELLRWNQLANQNSLKAGQRLIVAANAG